MFSLRHQIGSDAIRIAVFADDNGFGGASQEFNGAIESHELLGSSYVSVARADDLVHARNFLSSIGKGGDGLRTTDSVELAHAEKGSRRQGCLRRARRRNANLPDTGDLRGDHRQIGR